MAVLEVLSEMICSEKLLARVALSELVDVLEMADTLVPVLFRGMTDHRSARAASVAQEFVAAVAASIGLTRTTGALVKSSAIVRQS